MKNIAIISSSVREGRLSHRTALFLRKYVNNIEGAQAEILDLKAYDFPLFNERFSNMPNPTPEVVDFVQRISDADGVIIVSPVYNASFPAALKNVIDLLVKEWDKKPILVVSVTYGPNPGIPTVQQLQALLLKMGARVAAPTYTILNAGTDFMPEGEPVEKERLEKYAKVPVAELLWLVEKSSEAIQ